MIDAVSSRWSHGGRAHHRTCDSSSLAGSGHGAAVAPSRARHRARLRCSSLWAPPLHGRCLRAGRPSWEAQFSLQNIHHAQNMLDAKQQSAPCEIRGEKLSQSSRCARRTQRVRQRWVRTHLHALLVCMPKRTPSVSSASYPTEMYPKEAAVRGHSRNDCSASSTPASGPGPERAVPSLRDCTRSAVAAAPCS
jgi:hypothetical protein|eukprot:COSAG01_NODE_1951_length_8818_cov_40.187292_7_plen_193_part_00